MNKINDMEELQQYRAIGTIEELQELKEKSVAKKPYNSKTQIDWHEKDCCKCSNCDEVIYFKVKEELNLRHLSYCRNCGQKLDWK